MTSSNRTFGRALAHTIVTSWRPRVVALIAMLVGIALLQTPLFATLGFEHALATAVFASCVGIDTGSWLARRLCKGPRPASLFELLLAVGAAKLLAIALTVVPIALATLRASWRPMCDWQFGVLAEFGMPVISAALGAVVGFTVALTVGAQRPIAARVVPWLALLATAAHGLWRFYAAPPVFSYSPLVGYFPGNLYDEDITLNAAFWWARLDAALVVMAMFTFCLWRIDLASLRMQWRGLRLSAGPRLALMVCAVTSLAVAGMRHQGGRLGYAIDASDIDSALGGRIETKHFIIHYDRYAGFADDMNLIAGDHEFRYQQVVAQFGIAPTGKIHSYYFANTAQKARWMGARDVEMAKPWRKEIYLDHRDFPHSSLRHEIAHIVAGAAGDSLFAISARRVAGLPLLVNPGLIEGMAVALDWPGSYDRTQTPHQAMRVMQAMGVDPSINDLLSLGFLSLSSARSYTTAGSFLRYLLDTYGAEKVRAYYHNGGDLSAAFGRSAGDIVVGWRNMLSKVEVSDAAIAANKERFRGGSVFARPCPHAIAKAQRLADGAMADGDVATAVAALRDICNQDPGEPRHRLTLAAYLTAGDDAMQAESTALLESLAADVAEVSPAIRIAALQALINRRGHDGDFATAQRYLVRAEAIAADAGAQRQLAALRVTLDATGLFGQALRGYFFATNPTPAHRIAWADAIIAATPTDSPVRGIGWYLRGLRKMDIADWVGAADDLQNALALPLPSDQFTAYAARRLAIAGYRSNKTSAVRAAIRALQGHQSTDVDRLLAADWQARLAAAAISDQ